MKLKCIGGLADGELAFVHDDFMVGDQVRVPAKIEFKLSSFEEDLKAFRENRVPEILSIPYYNYRICALDYKNLNGPRQKLHYLIPYNWHEWEAIQHLFKSYT